MRIRFFAAFSFAFALGISLAFAPVETWARAGGIAGRAGVNAGVGIAVLNDDIRYTIRRDPIIESGLTEPGMPNVSVFS